MTSGTKTDGSYTYAPYYDIYGTAQNGLWASGEVSERVWSGGNAKPAVKTVSVSYTKRGVTYHKSKVVYVKYQATPKTKYLPPQPYEATFTRVRIPTGVSYWQTRYTVGQQLYSYAYWTNVTIKLECPGNLPPLPTFPANTWNDMINKLNTKVNGSDFNMSVFLGEGRETLALIGDTAISLAEAYRLTRKGRPMDAFRVLAERTTAMGRRLKPPSKQMLRGKTAGEWWLELQYGWKPLLGDMKSAAEMLAHRMSVPYTQRYVVRKQVNMIYPATFSDKWPNQPTDSTVVFVDSSASVSKQIVAYVKEASSIPQLSGILDPEVVLWELVPFSFVIDWALPIGDWLTARANASKISATFVVTTFSKQKTSGAKWHKQTFEEGGLTHRCLASSHLPRYLNEKISVSRTVSTSLSAALPNFKSLNDTLSLAHCLNGLALLTASFSKN